jgi:pimeloyl-ACP methyl ester carboxylesterase
MVSSSTSAPRPRRIGLAAVLLAALAVAVPIGDGQGRADQGSAAKLKAKSPKRCKDNKDNAKRLNLRVKGEKTFGYFALPNRKPRGLVVFAHGHRHSAILWRDNLRVAARRDDVVAVAMDYRHQDTDLDKQSPTYGSSTDWRVIEGAVDSIAAGKHMMRRCKRLKKRPAVLYGVSMGSNATGIALARRPERPGGRPLFDYWFNIEGVTDVVLEYKATRAVSGIDPQSAEIVAGMEEDFGGAYEERPEVYERHSPINLGPEIARSGVKGAVAVAATDDLLIYPQSRTMAARLREVGVPTQFFTVNPVGAAVGHGLEIDRTHPVIETGFDRLKALFKDHIRPRCFREFGVNSASGEITPDPASAAC